VNAVNAKPLFVVGSGRCGTHFLKALMENDPGIHALHFPFPEADSFMHYCLWNGLPVDREPFFMERRRLIRGARARGQNYFEANAYLSLAVRGIADGLRARIVHLVRDPEDCVNSNYVKGWYLEKYRRANHSLAPGLPPEMRINHSFGRILPKGDRFERWKQMTRIGKIAWMWNTINLEIAAAAEEVPSASFRLVKVEEIDYPAYLDLNALAGGKRPMSEKAFRSIVNDRPGRGRRRRCASAWKRREREEFERETAPAASILGYR
jgi:hypothetical protein